MKPVKSFSLLAAIAVVTMALLGSSTAMGETTALCKADESPCGSPVSHVHYTSKDMRITIPEMNYQCDVLLLADVSELGTPQLLEGKFTYTNCNQSCSREEVNGPASLSLLKTGHESGEFSGEGEIHSFCVGFLDCTYSFENLIGKAKGPLLSSQANGEISYEEVLLTKVSGFLCAKEAHLSATFVPLSATYISS
jgi:hypothetical protein